MTGLTLVPLWFYNTGTTPTGVSHTVFMSSSNIAASIELSHVAFGTLELASATAVIIQYKHFKDGKLTTVNMPAHVTSNCVFVQNCVEITFAIGGAWCVCAAVARILYF
jgi:hypothetical protein